jgi:cell division protein ZapB
LNLLTQIRKPNYSDEMISDFHQLSEKVAQLAELAQSLRRENADLRLKSALVTAENAELSKRMQEAHQRVSALLDQIPVAEQDEEAV